METDALWRRVIEVKYGNDWGGWCTKKVTSVYLNYFCMMWGMVLE